MKSLGIMVGLLMLSAFWWWQAGPQPEIEIAGPVIFEPMDDALERLAESDYDFASGLRRVGEDLPGYDDVVVMDDGEIIASAMDGWIWRVSGSDGVAEPWVDAPLMPAGLRRAPNNADLIYFCSARLHGASYASDERVGLYAVRRSTKEIVPIVLDVPLESDRSDVPQVFTRGRSARTSGTRPLAFCNDLDVSADGDRIYFSEPFAYEGASMGGGAVAEAIALGNNGRLWMHELSTGQTQLVARGFFFLDGVLIESGPEGQRERSVLVTETTRFRIQRLVVSGAEAGTNVVMWRDLPGMPDGLDRDADGNVWVGLLGLRSPTTDWIHGHPWIKPLLLRLPESWMPKGHATGVLVLSPKMNEARFLELHDGSLVRDVSVAIPSGQRIYLASFDPSQRGLVWIPRPEALSSSN